MHFSIPYEEADFQTGKVSVTSPVGQGLLGYKVGDKVKVKAPAGLMEFEILAIRIKSSFL
ncbi:MAG: GreA/GreB family elongation factor [Ignavibacteriales bacterium]|nr:GreA/GreB family elongation factor [Ignavibacteriales bacterium]